MILSNKRAFSLTELLIVLVVIAVLFAALAPIVTKRRTGVGAANESVWYYVNNDDQMDSYYDPGVPGWTSTAFFGSDPTKFTDYKPYAKMVVRASKTASTKRSDYQRHIQFRYGTGSGQNAGSLFLDGNSNNNILLTFNNDDFIKSGTSNLRNTVAGPGAFGNILSAQNIIAFGANALKGYKEKTPVGSGHFIAVGNKVLSSGAFKGSQSNIFIGASSAQSHLSLISSQNDFDSNIAVGANTMSSPYFFGKDNIYLGYLTGNGTASGGADVITPKNNVIVGSTMTGGLFSGYNTVLGYESYLGGDKFKQKLTSVGYYACTAFNTDNVYNSPHTCIGYKSGANRTDVDTVQTQHIKDHAEHVYLGGVPKGFAGRGVVEIHNFSAVPQHDSRDPRVSPSVVFNSNLVLRGGLTLASPENGQMTEMKFERLENNEHCWMLYECRDKCRCPSCWSIFGCRRKKKKWKSYCAYEYLFHLCGGPAICDPSYSSSFMWIRDYSDSRLKENIEDYDGGYEEILALMPYNYTFKSDNEKKPQVGVIAQDLQKVFPTAVSEGKDGYLRIRWDEIFYGMINSIKTLAGKVEKLASDIGLLESDVKQLKSSNKDIKKRIATLNSRAAKLERK